MAFLLSGCFAPPNRNQELDRIVQISTRELQPPLRGPVEARKAQPDDPAPPLLDGDVRLLSSEDPLQRVQANNRLRAAGGRGAMAIARFLEDSTEAGDEAAIVEAIRFLEYVDLGAVDTEVAEAVRAQVAARLSDPDARVRIRAARTLQIHGPGGQRTRFLQAIADPDRDVRWAVVRRFGEQHNELERAQRELLIGLLRVRSRADFELSDANRDDKLTREEYSGNDDEFSEIDADQDGSITLREWTTGKPSAVRADVVKLLNWIHGKLTPTLKPIVYDPYAPAAEQLNAVAQWTDWSNSLQN